MTATTFEHTELPPEPDWDQDAPPPPEDDYIPYPGDDVPANTFRPDPWTLPDGAVSPALTAGLNPEQARAVETLAGPLLIVAGPGSGKTRVLTHRVAALLERGVWASRILAVTFTNKAAAEMRDRIATLVGPDEARRMWVATFHSACVKILRMYHEEAGLPRAFSIVDSDDSKKVMARCAEALGLLGGLSSTEARTFLKDASSVISRAKNDNKSPADLARSSQPEIRGYAPLMEAYNARLIELGACDFDDLLLLTLNLLRTRSDVLNALQQRWWYISVDEFQDTNAVQYELIRLLSARHENLCVVGDADQSIYAFRGAQPSVVSTFTQTFPAAAVVVLEENYRSTENICAVSRAVIAQNPAQHRATLRTSNPPGDPVRLYAATDDRDEANWVVGEIRRRGAPWSGHAVLIRTAALTRSLEDRLKSHGVDYDIVGGLRFYDRAEIKDALAYLRLAMNPDDRLAFERAVATPRRGVGDAGVSAVFDDADAAGVSAIDAAAVRGEAGKGRGASGLAAFVLAVGKVAEAAANGPEAAVRAALEDTGLRLAVRAADDKEKRSDYRREENLDQLLEAAREFVTDTYSAGADGTPVADLDGWEQTVAWMESAALHSAADNDDADVPVDRVQILTMHSAKGKEFPHVYVVGLEENVLPHVRALGEGDGAVEEERRLLFVAVSRAQKTLDLSHCSMRVQFGKVAENAPSRFLKALPTSVVECKATRAGGAYGQQGMSRRPYRTQSGAGWATPAAANRKPTVAASAATRVVASGPRLTMADVDSGVRVRHAMFGDGTVIEHTRTTVTVAFDTVGQRQLSLFVAPLELIA